MSHLYRRYVCLCLYWADEVEHSRFGKMFYVICVYKDLAKLRLFFQNY